MKRIKPLIVFLSILALLVQGGAPLAAQPLPPQEEQTPPVQPPAFDPPAAINKGAAGGSIQAFAPQAPAVEWTYHKTADGAHPDGEEQQIVWLMNRARLDPTQEGIWLATTDEPDIAGGRDYFGVDLDMLKDEFASYDPKPPAAFDVRLYNAAKAHSDYLISIDAQNHDGQFDRISAAGFHYSGGSGYSARGSVFAYARSGLNAHGAWNIDWGGSDGGMQSSRGHRMAVMSVDGDYTNVGFAAVGENDPDTGVGPLVTTGNYCHANESELNHFNRFIVGTVWEDLDGNARYDPGEGIGGVTVMPDTGTYYAITGDSGGYAIPVPSGSYTVTFSGLVSAVKSVTVGDVSVLLDHVVVPTYEISGQVVDEEEQGIQGVVITASNDVTATTDATGAYTLSGMEPGTYTLTPQKTGYEFSPATLEVTVSDADMTGQDFTGTLVEYAISGVVTDREGTPLPEVTVLASTGMSTTTDANGAYTLAGFLNGTYVITPTKLSYRFEPASREVEVNNADVTAQDFEAVLLLYAISGQVMDSANTPILGVTLSAGTVQTTTDLNGTYVLTGLMAGGYTLTAAAPSYTFVPLSYDVNIVDSDVTERDFVGTRAYTLTGQILDSDGLPIPGVTVYAESTSATLMLCLASEMHMAVTDANGTYTIPDLTEGTYLLTPMKSGYTFVPSSKTVNVFANVTDEDFSVIDLRLSPGQTQQGSSGKTLGYTHNLTNTGDNTETYILKVSNSHDWPVMLVGGAWPQGTNSLMLPLVNVGPSLSAPFGISVTVPSGVSSGITATTYITVTSVTSPAVSVSIQDLTVVQGTKLFLPLLLKTYTF